MLDEKWIKPKINNKGFVWSTDTSVFKGFKYDTEEALIECFNFDWKCSGLDKFISDDSEEDQKRLKRYVMNNYKYIKAGFKYFSSFFNPKVFSIGQNSMQEFIKITLICDNFIN